MTVQRTFTAIYMKMPYSVFGGYIQEMPQIDSVHPSLEEVKKEIESKLDKWHCEAKIGYLIKEVYRNF